VKENDFLASGGVSLLIRVPPSVRYGTPNAAIRRFYVSYELFGEPGLLHHFEIAREVGIGIGKGHHLNNNRLLGQTGRD
jgi:hypothetical protein